MSWFSRFSSVVTDQLATLKKGGAAPPLSGLFLQGGGRSQNGSPNSAGLATSKSSRTGAVLTFHSPGQALWTPRDYLALAREGFERNAIVYRCVRMVCEAAASVPVQVFAGPHLLENSGEGTETFPHSLLEHPNPLQSWPELMEDWYGFLMVSGNAYLEGVQLGGQLKELYVLRPDRMKVVPGADGWPKAYDYTAGGHTIRIEQGDVPAILHMQMFHPSSDHYGLSPMEAAACAIDLHNQASQWNKSLLDNSARPSGALVYRNEEAHLTADQHERLRQELEESFSGSRNAGRPLLLEGGLDWKAIGYSPRDLDFTESRNAAAREIALAFGVPPMLLGIPGDNSFANYAEANRNFWRTTVIPLVKRSHSALSRWFAAHLAQENLRLVPDLDHIDALASERESRWKRLETCSFLTLNEKRAAAGYGPLEGGDVVSGDMSSITEVTHSRKNTR